MIPYRYYLITRIYMALLLYTKTIRFLNNYNKNKNNPSILGIKIQFKKRKIIIILINIVITYYVNQLTTRFVLSYLPLLVHLFKLYYLICTLVLQEATLALGSCLRQLLPASIGEACIVLLSYLYEIVQFVRLINTQHKNQLVYCNLLKIRLSLSNILLWTLLHTFR